ncbi:PRC-barrel domain containing protein [Streptacidiphilus neutrinimicus]|uniref:PRC-barrel domain containing protein n=1 Tax=Streptacidiphilus neutrinimicus TaxID=105420 RepID=UPI001F26BFEE|nr:PRC-barrel domain containing protein [Streptacidiphilus neutrinimicus]
METTGIWAYRQDSGYQPGMDLSGFAVEATDGRVGKVDKHNDEVEAGRIVVDTGMWIFGKQVLLPVGVISSIDAAQRVAYVARSRDEIKNAPEYDRDRHEDDPEYLQQLGAYYLMLPWH